MSRFWPNFVNCDICWAANDENFVKRLIQIWRFLSPYIESGYPMHKRIALTMANEAHPLWHVCGQFQILRNTFWKPDIPSWHIMPESWSSDNWIKKIAANADLTNGKAQRIRVALFKYVNLKQISSFFSHIFFYFRYVHGCNICKIHICAETFVSVYLCLLQVIICAWLHINMMLFAICMYMRMSMYVFILILRLYSITISCM